MESSQPGLEALVGNKFLAPHPYSGRTMQRMFGKGICIDFEDFHKNKLLKNTIF